MDTREEAIAYCQSFHNVYEDYPFNDVNWTCMRHIENQKVFAWIFERQGHIWINVKGESGWLDFFREKYDAVIPGYHLSKEHWNSMILDGSISLEDIHSMIKESYTLTLPKKGRKQKNIMTQKSN